MNIQLNSGIDTEKQIENELNKMFIPTTVTPEGRPTGVMGISFSINRIIERLDIIENRLSELEKKVCDSDRD